MGTKKFPNYERNSGPNVIVVGSLSILWTASQDGL